MPETELPFDALLVVSFGGPDGPDDVMPFLENVLRGKNVPRERMLEVSEHYQHFGGASPINAQNLALIEAVKKDLAANGIDLPVYWGNRNWHPMFADTLEQMKKDGIKKSLAFFTSIFSCYSGCRQYRENIIEAQEQVGPGAPEVHKLRMAFNHPLYIGASADRVQKALDKIPESRRSATRVVFTAHSIPLSMAENCKYETQLTEASRLIMEAIGENPWDLVYQSRSGPPQQPWLDPDICDHIQSLHDAGGFGSHGSHVRFGHRGDGPLQRVVDQYGPSGFGWRASGIRVHDQSVNLKSKRSGTCRRTGMSAPKIVVPIRRVALKYQHDKRPQRQPRTTRQTH